MTDISAMLGGKENNETERESDHGTEKMGHGIDGHADETSNVPVAAKMSPVERIRAFQRDESQFPEISRGDDSDDDIGDDELIIDEGDDDDLMPAVKKESAGIKGIVKENKTVLTVAGVLITAGIVLSVAGVGSDDSTETEAPVNRATPTSTNSAPASVVPVTTDSLIIPVRVDVSQSQCVTGSTDPMDAFVDPNKSTGKAANKKKGAFVCQMATGAPGILVTATLPSTTAVVDIATVPGFDGPDTDGKDGWLKYRLLSSGTWYFDNDPPKAQKFTSERKLQPLSATPAKIDKDKPIYTKTVSLVINTTTPVPANQTGTPTTSARPGIFGDLGSWGKSLGGDSLTPTAAPGAGGDPAAQGPLAFAIGWIKIIGHPAR